MNAPMPRKLPPYVVRERSRHGRVMFYFRRGKGPRIRLPDELQSPEFAAAYDDALTGRYGARQRMAAVPSNSLQWLVDRYRESQDWAVLSPATKKQRENIFRNSIAEASNPAFAGITLGTLQRTMDRKAGAKAAANNFRKTMAGLFKWARRNGHVTENPTIGLMRYKLDNPDGFLAWRLEDVTMFCTHWSVGTAPRLAFELFLASGLRRGDVHKVGPQHVKDGILKYRAAKNAVAVTVKLPQFLLETIAATPTGEMRFMVKNNGEPWTSKESFGNWFSKCCRQAGLETGKSAHGIRKLAATISADAGATTHELMAQFGWKSVSQAEIYTRGADRDRLGLKSSERAADHFENIMPRTSVLGAGKTRNNKAKSNG